LLVRACFTRYDEAPDTSLMNKGKVRGCPAVTGFSRVAVFFRLGPFPPRTCLAGSPGRQRSRVPPSPGPPRPGRWAQPVVAPSLEGVRREVVPSRWTTTPV
jgi:hypothetical protein